MIIKLVSLSVAVPTAILALMTSAFAADVKVWDLKKKYDYKHYGFTDQWADRDQWEQVPYGDTTTYNFIGDCAIEGENYWMSLHSSPYDAVFLYAKINEAGAPSRHNEMYRSYDTPRGYRAYSGGSQRNVILKNQPGEVMVYSEGLPCTKPDGVWSVVSTYRAVAGKKWIELRPVIQCSEQGMHGESRIHISPGMGTNGADYVADSMKYAPDIRVFHPASSIMLLDFIMDADIIWTMNWKKAATNRSRSDTTHDGYQAGWQYLNDDFMTLNNIHTSPFVYYDNPYRGLVGEPITVGVLYRDYWHFQNVGQTLTANTFNGTWTRQYTQRLPYETVAPAVGTPWKPAYPGKYRITGYVAGQYYTNEVTYTAADLSSNYTFTSPVKGFLEYLIMYLYEPTAETPVGVLGVKGLYDETIPATWEYGTISGTVVNESGQPISGATVSNGAVKITTGSDGKYTLTNIPVGVYPFVITATGYAKIIQSVDVSASTTSTINLRMAIDTAPPLIMNIRTSNITKNSCTISWSTDKEAFSQVQYGLTAGYGQSTTWSTTRTIAHSINLSGLTEDSLYHFKALSKDVNGNTAGSPDQTFATSPPLDDENPTWWDYYAGAGSGIWGRTYAEKHSGNFSAYLKALSYYSDNSINIGLIAGKSNGYTGTNAYAISPNTTYNYSYWIKGDVTSVQVSALTWKTDAAAMGDRVTISLGTVNPTGTWTQHSGTFTTKADTKKFVLKYKIYGSSTTVNLGAFQVDDVRVSVAGGPNLIQNPGAEAPASDSIPTATPTPFGYSSDNPMSSVVVGPNPYRAAQDQSQIVTFRNLPDKAQINIYTLSGKLVKSINHESESAGGTQEWDVSGVTSGVYIYNVFNSQWGKKGKISIIK